MAHENLVVAGLSFDTIRTNLRNYIASKSEFVDYDFADSAIGTLLDVLAYNTYINAFYANMAANEGFIDTAQFYDNVVSRAKALGYTPSSARGASANVKLIFTTSVANSTFRSITVPKDTKFLTSVNGTVYTFVTPQTYTISSNSTNGFASHIRIVEGEPLTHRYVYIRGSNTSFALPNQNVDASSIRVSVTIGGNTQTFNRSNDILEVNSSSKIFFVEPDRDQKYKIAFGDGILGEEPLTGSQIAVSYRVCNGSKINGSNSYTLVNTTIDGQTGIAIIPVGRASGGAEIESAESIRFNAPRAYETQNRCVTSEDYKRILLRDNPDIEAISVWGGEENVPPIYGKVFVSAKPKSATVFSQNRKQEIVSDVRKYNVQSIDIEITDPAYLYIVPEVTVRYDPDSTSLTPGELANVIANRIISFESEFLSNFGRSFRYSRFLDWIDSTDDSIKTTNANIRMRKFFTPSLSGVNSYTINFNNAIQKLGPAELISGVSRHPGYGSVTSTPFTYAEKESFFDDNGFGSLRIYYRSGAGVLGRVYTAFNAGTVDYDSGTMQINSFLPSAFSGSGISLFASPVSPNIAPVRNQILLLSQTRVDLVDDNTNQTLAISSNIDTIGQTATIQTPSIRLYSF